MVPGCDPVDSAVVRVPEVADPLPAVAFLGEDARRAGGQEGAISLHLLQLVGLHRMGRCVGSCTSEGEGDPVQESVNTYEYL